jgi:hypothetical protein
MSHSDDDARIRRLRTHLDRELSGLQATPAARDRLARGIRAGRPAPAGRRGGTARRHRQWLAVPLAAAAVAGVTAGTALLGHGLGMDGRRTGPAATVGPTIGTTRTADPSLPSYPTSHEVSGFWLILEGPRGGVTVGHPFRMRLVARREPFRSAIIKWGVTSATTTIEGHCPGDPGTAPPAEARHTYPVVTTVVVRAIFTPCASSRKVTVRLSVVVRPER